MDSEYSPDADTLSPWPKYALIGLLLLLSLGAFAAWLLAPTNPNQIVAVPPSVEAEPEFQPPSDTGYVGSEKCAQCHGQIAKSFKSHPMAQSASLIDAKSMGVDQSTPARVVGKQRVLDVEFRDGVMQHHERMFDAAGELIYDQPVSMKFAVGSGRRARAYVHQRGEALFMSPLNWYAQSKKWDLAPNYHPDDDQRFDRRVTDECLSCHTGRMAAVGRSLNRYQPQLFHEMAIGCENCHGPGELHVTFREGKAIGNDPIVNPAKLDHARRESVCNQCHLQTAVRVPRFNRSHFDFRPGQNFEEIWTALDTKLGVTKDGRTRSVNHVQQMRESRCYTQSDGKLGCVSCHDPHRVPAENERAAFYRQRCFQCHRDDSCSLPLEKRQAQENSCIACHLPTRKSKNISHVTQTDHRVIRTSENESEEPSKSSNEELALFNPTDNQLPDWERERALSVGAWIYLTKSDRKPPQSLARPLLRVLDKTNDDSTVILALGSLATQHQLVDRAREYYEQGRNMPAAEEESLWGLLNLYYPLTDWERSLDCADRLLALDPGYARVHALRADILRKLGREAEAIEAARRALDFNPTLVEVREWLVEACRATGREAEQRMQEEILTRMKDAHPPP